MEFKDVVFGRRSVRQFESTPISDEDLKEIIDAGLYAPSGVNLQPWYIVAVRSDEGMNKLRALNGEVAAAFEPVLRKRFEKFPQVADETLDFIGRLGGAPVCILAFLTMDDYGLGGNGNESMIQSVAAALENMALMAYDKGIGSCWMTAPIEGGKGEIIKELFAPDKGKLVAVMPMGYPKKVGGAPKRKDGRFAIV